MHRFAVSFLFVALSALALALSSCSTIPKVTDPSGVDVSVTQMTPGEISASYGFDTGDTGDNINPYLARTGYLTRQTLDFIVLQLKITAAVPAKVYLYRWSARGPSGNEVAALYSRDALRTQIDAWNQPGRGLQQANDTIRRSYLPSTTIEIGPGRRTYVLVFAGKHPMPLPATVVVDLSVNSGKGRSFLLTVNKIQ